MGKEMKVKGRIDELPGKREVWRLVLLLLLREC